MPESHWEQAIIQWRKLTPEERRRRDLEAIPRRVANSMAMAGEPVDEETIRELLARHVRLVSGPEKGLKSPR